MKNRLKVLRAERDWTQAQLADQLDVSRQTVNAIEKGKFDPSLPLAFKAARLFGLSIEDIFQDQLRRSAPHNQELLLSQLEGLRGERAISNLPFHDDGDTYEPGCYLGVQDGHA